MNYQQSIIPMTLDLSWDPVKQDYVIVATLPPHPIECAKLVHFDRLPDALLYLAALSLGRVVASAVQA